MICSKCCWLNEYDYEYRMIVRTAQNENVYFYVIEADNLIDAVEVTKKFFNDDHPDEEILFVKMEYRKKLR